MTAFGVQTSEVSMLPMHLDMDIKTVTVQFYVQSGCPSVRVPPNDQNFDFPSARIHPRQKHNKNHMLQRLILRLVRWRAATAKRMKRR